MIDHQEVQAAATRILQARAFSCTRQSELEDARAQLTRAVHRADCAVSSTTAAYREFEEVLKDLISDPDRVEAIATGTANKEKSWGNPHCNQYVLHRPGYCRYCDECPGRQQRRLELLVNFTGENREGFMTCPSEMLCPVPVRATAHDPAPESLFELGGD